MNHRLSLLLTRSVQHLGRQSQAVATGFKLQVFSVVMGVVAAIVILSLKSKIGRCFVRGFVSVFVLSFGLWRRRSRLFSGFDRSSAVATTVQRLVKNLHRIPLLNPLAKIQVARDGVWASGQHLMGELCL